MLMSVLDLHDIITKTVEKYRVSDDTDLRTRANLKNLIQDFELHYPITFMCALDPEVEGAEIVTKLDALVSRGILKTINIDNDPMLGKIIQIK